jgi:integrase
MSQSKRKKRTERISLPGGCSMSSPSVFPSNWKKISKLSRDWYIHYRFYDPVNRPAGKLIIAKGMNDRKTVAGRQQLTEYLIGEEIARLKGGDNPVTGQWTAPDHVGDLTEYTPLSRALQIAYGELTCVESTKGMVRSMLNWVCLGMRKMRMESRPVGEIETQHILQILNATSKIRSRWDDELQKEMTATWSLDKFNKYRGYLMMLFKRIKKAGAIKVNPCNDIELEQDKSVKEPRTTLTAIERNRINSYLLWFFPGFHRFLHIFFHSGARVTEILQVQAKHVDLERGIFLRTVKKGGAYRLVPGTIKDIALPLWKKAMEGAGPDDYLFSEGLRAGPRSIRREQITRRWKKQVKDVLGIAADFYSLKHSNSTETAALAGDQAAAAQNAHTSTAMVVKIYDVGRADREHERLKKVNNAFV